MTGEGVPAGFARVAAARAEIDAYVSEHGHWPTAYRLECQRCGARIWGTYSAVTTHRHPENIHPCPVQDERNGSGNEG